MAIAGLGELKAVMAEAQKDMLEIQKLSMHHQTQITAVTTFVGQVANRAAKQAPQG